MVKELDDPGLKGTRWVTVTPISSDDSPACRLAHASTERFMAKEWWSFEGVKGSLLFLEAADGDSNGGMPFRNSCVGSLRTGFRRRGCRRRGASSTIRKCGRLFTTCGICRPREAWESRRRMTVHNRNCRVTIAGAFACGAVSICQHEGAKSIGVRGGIRGASLLGSATCDGRFSEKVGDGC